MTQGSTGGRGEMKEWKGEESKRSIRFIEKGRQMSFIRGFLT